MEDPAARLYLADLGTGKVRWSAAGHTDPYTTPVITATDVITVATTPATGTVTDQAAIGRGPLEGPDHGGVRAVPRRAQRPDVLVTFPAHASKPSPLLAIDMATGETIATLLLPFTTTVGAGPPSSARTCCSSRKRCPASSRSIRVQAKRNRSRGRTRLTTVRTIKLPVCRPLPAGRVMTADEPPRKGRRPRKAAGRRPAADRRKKAPPAVGRQQGVGRRLAASRAAATLAVVVAVLAASACAASPAATSPAAPGASVTAAQATAVLGKAAAAKAVAPVSAAPHRRSGVTGSASCPSAAWAYEVGSKGKVLWKVSLPLAPSDGVPDGVQPVLNGAGSEAVLAEGHSLIALRLSDGHRLWRHVLPQAKNSFTGQLTFLYRLPRRGDRAGRPGQSGQPSRRAEPEDRRGRLDAAARPLRRHRQPGGHRRQRFPRPHDPRRAQGGQPVDRQAAVVACLWPGDR